MAQNLATKFSKKVDERFSTKLLTEPGTNRDYEWSGVVTVSVYSIDTVSMGNYSRAGANRYGNVTELGNSTQDLTLTRDRSFTFSIDKGNFTESMMITRSGEALARQIDEVVVPEIDTFVLAAMGTAAAASGKDAITPAAAVSATNAYSNFLALQESLSDDEVPVTGRVVFLTANYVSFLKQSNFILDSEKEANARHNGEVGQVDGTRLIVVPSSRMPAATELVLVHPSATVAPRKLQEYKTHDNPPGINGWLIEGREIYDAFILTNKTNAIAVQKTS